MNAHLNAQANPQMTLPIAVWLATRGLRWALWIAFFAYNLHFILNKADHVNQFQHLLLSTEVMMFGLGTAALFAGFFELMAREWARLPRPKFAQWIPSASDQPAALAQRDRP